MLPPVVSFKKIHRNFTTTIFTRKLKLILPQPILVTASSKGFQGRFFVKKHAKTHGIQPVLTDKIPAIMLRRMDLHLNFTAFADLLAAMKLRLIALLAALPVLLGLPAAAENTNALETLWRFWLPGGGAESSAALAPDGTIYQGTFRGWLIALTPQGEVKWQFKAGREIKSSPAVADDGTIYFGSRDRNFYALTPTGKLKWKFATGAWVDASPAIAADGTVYFTSWDKFCYALTPAGNLKWKFATSNVMVSSPAVATDGTIYFGSHDKFFYALSPAGKLIWKFTTGGEIDSSPAIGADGTVYFSSTDGNFYALHPDGTAVWQLHTGSYTASSPVLDEAGNIYLSLNQNQASLSRDGKIRWQRGTDVPVDVSPVVAANGNEYFSLPWLRLGGYNRTGEYQWEFHVRENNLQASPNLDAAGVIYTSGGQSLFALRPRTNAAPLANSSWPMWRANARHTGRVEK